MTGKGTVKAGEAMIRANRRITWFSKFPVHAEILSTNGTYVHVVRGDDETPLWCQTCRMLGHTPRCWAVRRVEDSIPAVIAAIQAATAHPAPEASGSEASPEPRKHRVRGWLEIMNDNREKSRLSVIDGGKEE